MISPFALFFYAVFNPFLLGSTMPPRRGGSLPTEDAALVLLFSLVASGQIKLRRIDGWRKIASVLGQPTAVAG